MSTRAAVGEIERAGERGGKGGGGVAFTNNLHAYQSIIITKQSFFFNTLRMWNPCSPNIQPYNANAHTCASHKRHKHAKFSFRNRQDDCSLNDIFLCMHARAFSDFWYRRRKMKHIQKNSVEIVSYRLPNLTKLRIK